ncbi:MAG: NfeD family protein [Clostridia bacterium]|nr:NfeD family protein [Clostridia bacterium]
MTYFVWIWLAILILSTILELISLQMVSIWFTFSSVVAIILDLCGVIIWVQVLVFCVLALVLLICLRRFSIKYLLKGDKTKTNVDSILNGTYKLLEEIDEEKAGSIKVNGVVWTAISKQKIKAGEKVVVTKIDGNKLIVKKFEEKGENE